MNNQEVIDTFFRAGNSLGIKWQDMMARAGLVLTDMADPPAPVGTRDKPYLGAPIDTLPGLTDEERGALRTHMVHHGPSPTLQAVVWEHHAEPGLHGPSDSFWSEDAFEVVKRSKVKAIKVLVPNLEQKDVDRLREINRDMFIVGRLFSAQLNQRQSFKGDGSPVGVGHWFANEMAAERDRTNPLTRAVAAGIEYFEVHNEPNLTDEGLTVNWQNGQEFALFYQTVVNDLKPRFPNAKFGFPGLSPGGITDTRRIEMYDFLDQAQPAVAQAEFMACHFYWGNEGIDQPGASALLLKFCEKFRHKKVLCTEFSNNRTETDREVKAREYVQFYRDCKNMPANLGAMFAYVISWQGDQHNEGFLKLVENGHFQMTSMADALGAANI